MGKSSPDPPPAPVQVDPRKTAGAQLEFGKKAALYNKQLAESTFQETPYGTLRYETIRNPRTAFDELLGTESGGAARVLGRMTGSEVKPYYGSSSDMPITKRIQELHPAEQALLDQQRALKGQYGGLAGQLMGKAGGLFSTPLDTSSLGAMPGSGEIVPFDTSSLGDMPAADEATRQNMIDSILGRFQPQQASDRAALETQLANQGFVRGSRAWDSAMDEANRRESDFRLAANLQAGGEMRADVAQQMGVRGQGLQELLLAQNERRANVAQQMGIRGQSLQELLLPRNQTLQELSTFMTGSQPTMPQFAPVSSPQVGAPDYAGLAVTNAQMQNQANMAAYNAQMQNQGGSGLGSLLGTAAGAYFGGVPGALVGGSVGRGLGGWRMG